MRLLAKRREDRPASAQAVLQDLQAIQRQLAQPAPTVVVAPEPVPAAAGVAAAQPPAKRQAAAMVTAAKPPADKQAQPQRRRPRRWPLVAAALLGVAGIIVLGGVIIRITNKDGKVTEINVPDGSKVTINAKGEVDVKLPGAGEKPAPVVQMTASPFDKLDPDAIPKEERFAWQPKELVAVIGKHERRSWWDHYAAAFSDDGSLAATGSTDITIWDVKTQTAKMVIPSRNVVWQGPEYFPETLSVRFLAGGKHVLCFRAANGSNLQLWDISGKEATVCRLARPRRQGPDFRRLQRLLGPSKRVIPLSP